MTEQRHEDWQPRSASALEHPLATYDEMRKRCPVAYSDYLGWSVFRHRDVTRVVHDHRVFSNAVSAHTSVPNTMDPPVHTGYRKVIEPYFSPARMAEFEPVCRAIARERVESLQGAGEVELMEALAHPFALDIQCAFTGWPTELREPLRQWMQKNHRATLSRDRSATAAVAAEFEGFVKSMLEQPQGEDVVSRLAREKVFGKPMTAAEITSILRNWTVGELGTIAASVGILVHHLAGDRELQSRLRERAEELPAAIEEVLRLRGPLLSNRRVVREKVELGGRRLEPGDRVTVMWASANRDEEVFENPEEFRLHRDQGQNLLYGAGIHVCPGAPLARLELRLVMETLLQATGPLTLHPDRPPVGALYPAAGFSELWVRVG